MSDEGSETVQPSPAQIFDRQAERLALEPERTAGWRARYQFEIAGQGGGDWTIDVTDGSVAVVRGRQGAPDVTVAMDADDFVAMNTGALDGGDAFFRGKLRVKGDLGKAMRLSDLLAP